MKKIILIVFLILLFNNSSFPQNDSFYNFKENESICYCSAKYSTPDYIAGLDNNWELLIELKQPKTKSQLDSAGIKCSMSQLQLLKQWNLIGRNKDGTYQTLIKIFEKEKTEALREYSQKLSLGLIDIIKPDILNLKSILKKAGREKNTFSILFSYIIDGMVWSNFEKNNILNKNVITIEKPFWSGEFWTLYPKRNFYCGTNSLSDKGYSLVVNWSDNSRANMKPFFSRFDLLDKILSNYIDNTKVTDKEAMEVYSEYNLFDKNGYLTIPIITESDDDPLFNISKDIAIKTSEYIINNTDTNELITKFNLADKSQAIIIVYHEVLWDILDILEKENIISKPEVFKNPESAKPKDVSDLILLIKEK